MGSKIVTPGGDVSQYDPGEFLGRVEQIGAPTFAPPITGVPAYASASNDPLIGFPWDQGQFVPYQGIDGGRVGYWYIPNFSGTPLVVGLSGAASIMGSQFGAVWANTNLRTRTPRAQYSAAGAADQAAGLFTTGGSSLYRGLTTVQGGFVWWCAFAIFQSVATHRLFMGLRTAVAAPSFVVDPSTFLNDIYFGCDSTESNLSLCSNDGAGIASKLDLGANFPAKTDGAFYQIWFYQSPGSPIIRWGIKRLDIPFSQFGSVNADLPVLGSQLNWMTYINTGPGAVASATFEFFGIGQVMRP